MIFEEFGLAYYGPIDGHNLPMLIETFRFLKQLDRPVILHVLTKKGKGFQPALEKQKKFHGLGPYDPETGETKPTGQKTYSEVFAETLTKLADMDEKVVAITAAMPNGTALDLFRPHHPDSATSMSASPRSTRCSSPPAWPPRASSPFCAIYSTFLQRAFDQVVHDVCSAESSRRLLHGSRRSFRRRRPDPPWPLRHQLSARHPQHHPHGPQGRGRAGRT